MEEQRKVSGKNNRSKVSGIKRRGQNEISDKKEVAPGKRVMRLRQVRANTWAIYGPKGNMISSEMMFGDKDKLIEWAKAYVSSWIDIKLEIEDNETETR